MATQRVEIKNPVGFNSSLEAADLPDAMWTNAQNVTFRNGKSFRMGGTNYGYFSSNLSGFPGGASFSQGLYQAEEQGTPVWILPGYSKIGKYKSGTYSDVTRSSSNYSGDLFNAWGVTNLNTVVVMTNEVDLPQSKLESAATFVDLPNWPTTYRCKSIRAYKNYLIALGISSNGTSYPSTVKWSSPADPGQVPASWDVASVTSDAGENSLSDSVGSIVDGCSLRDSFIIYKDTSVYSMTYVGGTYIFSFRKIFDNAGIMARDCVVEYEGGHFVFGQNDVYVHNGVQKQSIISGKAKEELFSLVDRRYANKCFVTLDPSKNEIWCCFPPSRSNGSYAYCSLAFVWNWIDNTWTKRDLPQTTNGAFWGTLGASTRTWQDLSWASWYIAAATWDYSPSGNTNKGLAFGNGVYDETFAARTGTTIGNKILLEKTGINLGDDEGVKCLTSITPHLSGVSSGPIKITIGTQEHQDGLAVWQTPLTFNAGQDFKVDCRVTGRYMAIRFEWDSVATSAVLTGFTGEFQPIAGRR